MSKLVSVHKKGAPVSVLEMDDVTDGSQLSRALSDAVEGEVRFGAGDRALYSTDAGNYRFPPIGVVVPKHADDVVRAVEVCRRFGAPILSRGGGTSLAGQCCNHAVVLDFSKYMREWIDVDAERRLARVMPGIVLDDLNHEAARHGLTFGPDPATHDHCTLGGMIGNNSCGVHSVQSEFYGPGIRTEDHVAELDVLTYDGARMRVGPTSEAELEAIVRAGGRRGEIYGALRQLRDRYADLIRSRFPDIPRRVSGYNLPALLPENGFDVARLLVGSESTLVTVLEATVKLGPTFPCRALLVLGYEDIAQAGDDVPRIRELETKPIALEGIDGMLVDFIKRKGLHAKYVKNLTEGDAWLLVEFGGHTPEEAEDAARRAVSTLTRPGREWPKVELVTDHEEQEHIWQVRESGLGATAFVPGRADEWPGWEDSAVHPDRVGPYLRALRELYARYDYQTALYGHLGQGCIHCRLPFDLRSAEGIAKYRRFTQEAAELVVSFGGALSGEHGDGQARGELLPIMYGHELVEAFRELKRIWDPAWKMNPGKIVDARPRTADLRLGPEYPRWEPETRAALRMDDGKLSRSAMRCVGVGKCRREGGGTMCPSYMVTLEEKHSTRGRSRMLFELMRGEELSDGWKSQEVKDALDLCLSCKGCKSDCPVNVDMALYKAEFLYHHYQEKRRPRQAYAFGLIDKWARLGTRIPGLANWATSAPLLGTLAKKTAGIATEREIPKFAKVSFRRWFEGRVHANADSPRRVLLWPDTFNNYFFPRTLAAAVEVLESAGVDVAIPAKVLCCGRPLYDYGMLDRAERYWREILDTLRTEIIAGTTIVGVEPSCVAAFRDELLQMMPNDPLAKQLSNQTKTLGEYLDSLDHWAPPRLEGKAVYHGHCHHKAVMGVEAEHHVLHRMGLSVETPATGCCGMAGAFGFESDHYDVSVACGERVLLPKVRELGDDTIVIADGFSCREQIEQLTDRQALHVAEVMQLALHRHELAAARDRRPEAQVIEDLRPPELAPAGVPAGRAAVAVVGAAAIGSAAWWWLAPLLGH